VIGLDRDKHRLPLTLDRPAVGVQLDLETRLSEHLFVSGDLRGQVHAHADRHHTQIHGHLHGQPQHIACIVDGAAQTLPCPCFRCW
jgi:hypothetical protein